jgi:hypothetical protein
MKIGLKFCGGCNPAYDRLRLADRLRERFGDKVEWVSHESRDADRVVVIAGCATACVDLSRLKGLPVHVIAAENDWVKLISEIEASAAAEK